MITARGVVVRAGAATLVGGVSLEVAAGELVALVGPNGAGKSTLLAALAGDRALAAGSIALAGRDVRQLTVAELARRRAVLPQRAALAAPYTAREVVQLARADLTAAAADALLAEVGLDDLAHRRYPSLSGGEQQRVQLARVLGQLRGSPGAALLLDEPTSALDPRHQGSVLGLARAAARAGHPVVCVLHDLTLAARWADRVVLLAGGVVLATGGPAEVLTPAHLARAYTTEFEILRGQGGIVITQLA